MSLYEKLGGQDAVNAAVDIFYEKVLSDPALEPFFHGVHMMRQKAKQKAFLTLAFGGPDHYAGKDMTAAHAELVERGLDDSHVDRVIGHLGATLTELGVPQELIGEAAAIAESVRDAVLGRTPVAH